VYAQRIAVIVVCGSGEGCWKNFEFEAVVAMFEVARARLARWRVAATKSGVATPHLRVAIRRQAPPSCHLAVHWRLASTKFEMCGMWPVTVVSRRVLVAIRVLLLIKTSYPLIAIHVLSSNVKRYMFFC
jgi:hypothetical protein